MRKSRYTVTESTFDVGDGLDIAYTDYRPVEDKGLAPILYLPGFMRTARDFDRVAPLLADERRIVTIDTRGRGKAARARDASAYHFDRLIEDVWALAGHLGIERMVLAGLALGAFMAWRMGAAQPDRVLGIIANDTGTETSSPSGKKMIANADHGSYTLDEAAEKLRNALAPHFPDFGPEDWRVYARQIYADRGQGYVRDFDPLWLEELKRFKADTPTLWPEFARLTCPVALLRGENSDYLSREQAQKMADALPDCTLVHVQCRGHSNLLDEPASLGTIRAVLARCDQR